MTDYLAAFQQNAGAYPQVPAPPQPATSPSPMGGFTPPQAPAQPQPLGQPQPVPIPAPPAPIVPDAAQVEQLQAAAPEPAPAPKTRKPRTTKASKAERAAVIVACVGAQLSTETTRMYLELLDGGDA